MGGEPSRFWECVSVAMATDVWWSLSPRRDVTGFRADPDTNTQDCLWIEETDVIFRKMAV